MTISLDSFVGHIQIGDKVNTLIWAKVTESNDFSCIKKQSDLYSEPWNMSFKTMCVRNNVNIFRILQIVLDCEQSSFFLRDIRVHARSRFVPSAIPEEKWGLLVVKKSLYHQILANCIYLIKGNLSLKKFCQVCQVYQFTIAQTFVNNLHFQLII